MPAAIASVNMDAVPPGRNQACSLDEHLARARTGEQAAFAALMRAHQRCVYSLALRMLVDPGLAEDLAQEVFLQLYRKLASIQSPAHLAFWLRKVTANRAIDRLRQRPQFELASLEQAEVQDASSNGDPLLQRQLRQLVSQLAPAARAVVLLRYQEDLGPREIALMLDMSINTVKSHLKRSLATLRQGVIGVADSRCEATSDE